MLALAGCGKTASDRVAVHPVEGQVTFGGQATSSMPSWSCIPARRPIRGPCRTARPTAQGRFQLTTYDANDGAAPGEYAVTVVRHLLIKEGESYSPGPNALAPRVATPETTDILVKVAEGPNKLAPIEVKR